MAAGAGSGVIVAGASAGGVAALRRVVAGLPAALDTPLVIVQHLPRDRPSIIPALLAQATARPVLEAEDKMRLHAGHVYVAPPDYHLLIEDRSSLALSVDEPVLFSRPAIDLLFESAAHVFGPGVLALLLTGASADGSAGAVAVRRAGGRLWIQDPADAEASLMPLSALAAAGADAVLTLDAMIARLADER